MDETLLREVYPKILPICQKIHLTESQIRETLEQFWLPLAMQLMAWRETLNRPLIQGFLGGQGTGKTTLAAILTRLLTHFGYSVVSLSLDDLYKTHAERQQLKQQDPRLIWRGPPGTHNIELGIQVLEQLRQSQSPVFLPRFDKLLWQGDGDQIEPERVEKADIILFEGWFVGMRPISPAAFETAPAPIVTVGDRLFAHDNNERLRAYLPLWERLDRLIVLVPTDYRLSQAWRKQAEQEARTPGNSGMTDDQIHQFVEYFWKSLHPDLFLPPLLNHPDWVDGVIKINPDHSVLEVKINEWHSLRR